MKMFHVCVYAVCDLTARIMVTLYILYYRLLSVVAIYVVSVLFVGCVCIHNCLYVVCILCAIWSAMPCVHTHNHTYLHGMVSLS